jgi:hypothetical protein
MNVFQDASDRGELHVWIAGGLTRIRIVNEWLATVGE